MNTRSIKAMERALAKRMTQVVRTEQRIAFRVDSEQKDLIERGAEARGLTVTDYVKTLAIKDAEQALVERTFFTVSAEAYDQFAAILDRPVQPNPLLGKQVRKSKGAPEMAIDVEKIRKNLHQWIADEAFHTIAGACGDMLRAYDQLVMDTSIDKTYCSQCGGEFGPGDSDFSHCSDHGNGNRFVINRLRTKPVSYSVRLSHLVIAGEWQMGVEFFDVAGDMENRARIAADLRRAAEMIENPINDFQLAT